MDGWGGECGEGVGWKEAEVGRERGSVARVCLFVCVSWLQTRVMCPSP